jgi:hypothetical protein
MAYIKASHPANEWIDWNNLVHDITKKKVISMNKVSKEVLNTHKVLGTLNTFIPTTCVESVTKSIYGNAEPSSQKLRYNNKEVLSVLLYDDNLYVAYSNKETYIYVVFTIYATTVYLPEGRIELVDSGICPFDYYCLANPNLNILKSLDPL